MYILRIQQKKNSEFLAHPAFSESGKLQNRHASVISSSAPVPGMCIVSIRHTRHYPYLVYSRTGMLQTLLQTRHSPDPSKSGPGMPINNDFIFHNYSYMRHSQYLAVSVSGNPNPKCRTRHVHNQYPANKEFRVSGPPGILSIYKTSKQASFSRIKLCTWHVYSQCPAHLVSGTFQNGHVPVPDPDPAFSGPIKILKTHQPTFIYFS